MNDNSKMHKQVLTYDSILNILNPYKESAFISARIRNDHLDAA